MADLIYSGITSLDGYTADRDGRFDWSAPDAEVHAFVNDLERPVGTYLYGRRMYEVMVFWEILVPADEPAVTQDFTQIWRAADKVVYSRTLEVPASARTRIERDFRPEGVRSLKENSDRDLGIGGAGLAAHAIRAGLVDEYRIFVTPVAVGGGTAFLPDDVHLDLELLDQHRFASGVVYLRYRARR